MVAGCVIALTGGIGSGKSTVTDMFARLGAAVVDTDVIAHELTQPAGRAMGPIAETFGAAFVTPLGALDRDAMRAHVFADPGAKQLLEAILHPMIRAEADAALQRSCPTAAYSLLVVPLLFESTNYRGRPARVLAVDCPTSVQFERVRARSGLDAAQIARIVRAQVSRACRLQMADDVICNGGDRALLESQVTRLHQAYLCLAQRAA